jgi:hypothetical protein
MAARGNMPRVAKIMMTWSPAATSRSFANAGKHLQVPPETVPPSTALRIRNYIKVSWIRLMPRCILDGGPQSCWSAFLAPECQDMSPYGCTVSVLKLTSAGLCTGSRLPSAAKVPGRSSPRLHPASLRTSPRPTASPTREWANTTSLARRSRQAHR